MKSIFFRGIVCTFTALSGSLKSWSANHLRYHITYAKDSHGLRTLPSEFVNPQDGGEKNPLYYVERNPSFLPRGTGFRTGNEVSAAGAFRKTTWLDSRSTSGFSFTIEQTPHGNVHVAVGTTEGMGDTPKAARDPISGFIIQTSTDFGKAGGDQVLTVSPIATLVARSPLQADWRSHDKFAFAGPGGERIEMSVLEILAASKKLGTQYDRLDDVPAAMGIAGDPTRRLLQRVEQRSQFAGRLVIETRSVIVVDAVSAKVLFH